MVDLTAEYMELGRAVMETLDKIGVRHSYYDVLKNGIAVTVFRPDFDYTYFLGPLHRLDFNSVRAVNPFLYLLSADLNQVELITHFDQFPEWAQYYGSFQIVPKGYARHSER